MRRMSDAEFRSHLSHFLGELQRQLQCFVHLNINRKLTFASIWSRQQHHHRHQTNGLKCRAFWRDFESLTLALERAAAIAWLADAADAYACNDRLTAVSHYSRLLHSC